MRARVTAKDKIPPLGGGLGMHASGVRVASEGSTYGIEPKPPTGSSTKKFGSTPGPSTKRAKRGG